MYALFPHVKLIAKQREIGIIFALYISDVTLPCE